MNIITKTKFFAALLFIPSLLQANQDFDDLLKAGIFLDNLPPWEIYEAPPRIINQDPPVFLDVDSDGNVYTQKITLTKSGTYDIAKRLVTISELNEINLTRTIIYREMESSNSLSSVSEQSPMALGSTSCPLDPSFSIVASGNYPVQATGGITAPNTSRPVGATTQWLVFDFYTTNYRGRGSHMPLALFHENVLHGWGAFIGDNHASIRWDGSYAGCGSSSRFNSQIEGWIQTVEPDPSEPDDLWQSYTFNGSNSCGNEMYDGKIYVSPSFIPRYRFEMQTSTGHWVSYRILQRFTGSATWQTLTDWKTLDVDTGNWQFMPLQWLTGTEGILMGATPSRAGTGSWSINMFNVDCGWF